MSKSKIEQHLISLNDKNSFDEDFLNILVEANRTNEDSETITEKVLQEIKDRHDKNKKD